MTGWSPELDFLPSKLLVRVVVVTSPDISLLYKLTLATVGFESEQILLKESWMCFALSLNGHFHVKLLIIFPPP